MTGFWGNVTSSINWCETDYAYTYYIAEFFNCISSFAMFVGGLLGLVLHSSSLDLKFKMGFYALMVVGIGSALFHGTLLFELQMLDEVPMLWTALIMVYALLTPPGARSDTFKRNLCIYLFFHGLVTTYLVSSNNPYQFYVFHVSFGSSEFYCLFMVIGKYRACNREKAKQLYKIGLYTYMFAIFCWFLDLNYCLFFNDILVNQYGLVNPQLHSWWHVFVTGGLYLNTVMIIEDQENVAGNQPSIKWHFNIIPAVVTKMNLKKH